MNSNRIKVFHRADSNYITSAVTHNFKLNFFPARYTFFNQNLMNRRTMQTIVGNLTKLCPGICNTASSSTKSKSRPDNCRKSNHILCKVQGILVSRNNLRRNTRLTNCFHCILKHLPVFCLINCKRAGSQKLYPVTFQKARFSKLHTQS